MGRESELIFVMLFIIIGTTVMHQANLVLEIECVFLERNEALPFQAMPQQD